MKWYYPEKGELPDKTTSINGDDIECLCEVVINEESYLYGFFSERFRILDYYKNDKEFSDGGYMLFELKEIKRWCYLDEAISKLDE